MSPRKNPLYTLVVSFLSCLMLSGCFVSDLLRTNNHNRNQYGVLTVSVDTLSDRDWTMQQHEVIVTALREVERLGPSVRLVRGDQADVVIYRAELDCSRRGISTFNGSRTIRIDPSCASSSMELQHAIIHQLGHYLGMKHVCRNNETGPDCSPVGYGHAVMNGSTEVDSGPDFDSAYMPVYPTWEVTDLDVQEFRRAWAARHRR